MRRRHKSVASRWSCIPTNVRLQYNLAFAELVSGRLEEALAHFDIAYDLDPQNEEVLLRIHMALAEHSPRRCASNGLKGRWRAGRLPSPMLDRIARGSLPG